MLIQAEKWLACERSGVVITSLGSQGVTLN